MARKKKTSHSSGLYRKRVKIGTTPEGKPIMKAVYGHTKEELENKIAEVRVEKGMGITVTDNKSTWGYWAEVWKKLTYPPLGKSTQGMYDCALKHLSPLNSKKISKLTSLDLVSIVADMGENGYSKKTIRTVIATASQICRIARKNKAMAIDISEEVKAPITAPKAVRKAVSIEVQNALWMVSPLPASNKADQRRAERLPLIRMFALAQLCCGLRREEAAALRWDNVDLKAKTISIAEAYDFKGQRVKEPKTSAGNRAVPIPERYAIELTKWQQAHEDSLLGRKYVFCGNNGIITEGEFARLWDILLDAMSGITISDRISAGRKTKGVRPELSRKYQFTSHQLRHTYATNAIASGVDVRTVQYLMGHETAEMTMHYTHLSSSALADARKKLNASTAV